jgi:hypothetical protein
MNGVDLHANPDDVSSDEEEYSLPEDWNDLGTDEELAMLAINEMSLTELDDDCTLKNKVCIFNTPTVAKFTHLKACFFAQRNTVQPCIMPLSIPECISTPGKLEKYAWPPGLDKVFLFLAAK